MFSDITYYTSKYPAEIINDKKENNEILMQLYISRWDY